MLRNILENTDFNSHIYVIQMVSLELRNLTFLKTVSVVSHGNNKVAIS